VPLEPDPATPGRLAEQLPLTLPDRRGELRYSTRALLATEQALLGAVGGRRDGDVAVVPRATVRQALAAHPTLSPEQAALVWS
jgi:hypothetical protein